MRFGVSVALQVDSVVDAGGTLFAVVADEDEGLAGALAEGLDDVLHQAAIRVVEAVQRLVEDEQFWVLDEGTRQEDEALFAARHLEERALGKVLDAEDAHPPPALLLLLFGRLHVEPN